MPNAMQPEVAMEPVNTTSAVHSSFVRPKRVSLSQVFLDKCLAEFGSSNSPSIAHRPIRPYRPGVRDVMYSSLSAFLSMCAVSAAHGGRPVDAGSEITLNAILIGSFGATAVLIYHETKSALAQPYNVFVGHGVSCIIGVCIVKILAGEHQVWVAGPLAVCLAIAGMGLTNSMHPPGGATALVAVLGQKSSFTFVLAPVLSGIALMLFCAVILNNLHPDRSYPRYWRPRFSTQPRVADAASPVSTATTAADGDTDFEAGADANVVIGVDVHDDEVNEAERVSPSNINVDVVNSATDQTTSNVTAV